MARELQLQLNKYETAPYFFFVNQNLIGDCLLNFVFYPVLTWIYLIWTWNCSVLMFNTILGSYHANSGKNGKKQKSWNNWMSNFGLIEKIWSCLIFFCCTYFVRYWDLIPVVNKNWINNNIYGHLLLYIPISHKATN